MEAMDRFQDFLKDRQTVSSLRFQTVEKDEIADCFEEQRVIFSELAKAFRESEVALLPEGKAEFLDKLVSLEKSVMEALEGLPSPWEVRCNSHYKFKKVPNSSFYERVVMYFFFEIRHLETREIIVRESTKIPLSENFKIETRNFSEVAEVA